MDPLLRAARRRWPLALAAYVALWTVPGLVSTSQLVLSYRLRGDDPPLGIIMRLALPGWWVWGLLAPAIYLAARRWPLDGPGAWRRLPRHLALNAALALTWVGVLVGARRAFGLPGGTDLRLEAASALGTALLTYWVIVGVAHLVRYHQDRRARALRAAEMAAELSEARLAALSAQLHPHFLFNTLHAVSAFVRSEPDRAETMLAQLADLLREVMDASDRPVVTLQREFDLAGSYLAIQRTRLGQRLDVDVRLDEGARDIRVPTLVLQPLVENAVEHGVARRRRGGRVWLRAVVEGDGGVTVEVRDDGPGLAGADAPLERIGLGNTRARLAHHFGDAHDFRVENGREGGAVVRIRLPAPAAAGAGR